MLNNIHLIDKLPSLTKIEIVDGNFDDIVVSYDCYNKMKQNGIILNNVDFTGRDKNMFEKIIPPIVKTINSFSFDNYSIKELLEKKIAIRILNNIEETLKEITIPSYQTKIYTNFNFHCKQLTNITIPFGVKEIESSAFTDNKALTSTSIKSLTIPSSVTSFGKESFNYCTSLTSIEYEGEIDGNVIKKCCQLEKIPPIKSLEIGNFEKYRYLSKIILNNSIETIPISCFNKCLSLQEITIPTQCTSIESFAFRDCISLTSIHLPKSVKKINDGAFMDVSN